jgi:DNA-binding response OmpR family regulator
LIGVLVLTGDLTPERQAEVKHLGAEQLLAKPIDVNDLVARLHRLNQQRSQRA